MLKPRFNRKGIDISKHAAAEREQRPEQILRQQCVKELPTDKIVRETRQHMVPSAQHSRLLNVRGITITTAGEGDNREYLREHLRRFPFRFRHELRILLSIG